MEKWIKEDESDGVDALSLAFEVRDQLQRHGFEALKDDIQGRRAS